MQAKLEGYCNTMFSGIKEQMEQIREEIKSNESKILGNKNSVSEAAQNISQQKRNHEEVKERLEMKIKNMEEKVKELEDKLERSVIEGKQRDQVQTKTIEQLDYGIKRSEGRVNDSLEKLEKKVEDKAVYNIGGEVGSVETVIAGALESFKEDYLNEKLKNIDEAFREIYDIRVKDSLKSAQGKIIFKSSSFAGVEAEDEKHIYYLCENLKNGGNTAEEIRRMFELNGVKFNVQRHGRVVYSIIADCGGPKEAMIIFNFCKKIFKEKRNSFYVEFLTDRRMAKSEYLHRYILDCIKMDFKDQIENGIVLNSTKGPEIHLWLKSVEGCFVFNPNEQKYPKN